MTSKAVTEWSLRVIDVTMSQSATAPEQFERTVWEKPSLAHSCCQFDQLRLRLILPETARALGQVTEVHPIEL